MVALLAFTNAGIIQGPSSKTTLVGPEGSVISAVAPGGQIVHEEHPGVIAHAHQIPVVAHQVSVAHQVPVLAHDVPTTVVAHDTGVHGHENAIISGPSGTVARGHGVVVVPVVSHADVDDNGHEGQYVHDHSETLYDDGSYRPHY
ncbi:uncharacterized protein LOC126734910 isoform X2 [Anthonomus grandis grandis]|nr:uncharacterized protein LOC126734910 isoform X2 [Anthonomus grandis grandis]XP_050294703.1 uncharacterized protein LOC126734910 isoform X2 [Anthonomus grandis grandis]